MKISAVVTIYYPNQDVVSNVKTFFSIVDEIILIINSFPQQDALHSLKDLLQHKNVTILYPEKNLGIAGSYNLAIEKSIKDNFNYLLLLDQDTSLLSSGHIIEILKKNLNDPKISMVGISSSNDKSDFVRDLDQFTYSRKILMSSGTFIKPQIAKELGGFNQDFFIDEVDHEFSLRSYYNGYQHAYTKHIYLKHSVGESYKITFPFNILKKDIIIHKPFRYHFIFRNGRKIIFQYLKIDPGFAVQRIKYLLKTFLKVCIFYPKKLEYINFILKSFYRKNHYNILKKLNN